MRLRNQVECLDVARPDSAEVSVVEGRQCYDAHSLSYRNDRRVDEAEPEVCVLLNERDGAFVVVHREIDNADGAGCDESEEGRLRFGAEAAFDQPRRLGDHGHCRCELSTMGTHDLDARRVLSLTTVGGREEHARVDQQHVSSGAFGELAIGGLATDPLDVERLLITDSPMPKYALSTSPAWAPFASTGT